MEVGHDRRPRLEGTAMTPAFWLVVTDAPDTVVVGLHGVLDPVASVRLGDLVTDLIEGQAKPSVVVDLRHVGPVDLAALEVFAAIAAAVERRGGVLTLRWPSPETVSALTALGLAGLISRTPGVPALRATAREEAASHHPAGTEVCTNRADPGLGRTR